MALEQQQKIPKKEEEAGINLKVGKLFLRNALKLCSHFRNWANTRMLGRAQCHRLLTLSTLTKRHCTTTTSNDVQKPKLKKSRPLPPTTTETQRLVREDFYRREADWEALVDFGRLTEQERVIHQCHKEAVAGLHLSYEDPFTGLKVMSRWRHFSKGSCCGKACRHCVWDHLEVPAERKAQRIYNSAFWIDKPGLEKEDE